MPISIITVQPHNIRGGPALQHLNFLSELVSHDIRCHVVIPPEHELEGSYRDVAESILEVPELGIIPRTGSPLKLTRHVLQSARGARKIARHARSVRASVVHTFSEALLSGPWGARAARLPSAIHIIGMSVFDPAAVRFAYSRLLSFNADALLCCQTVIRDTLAASHVPPHKLHVIYNSIDIDGTRRAAAIATVERSADTVRIGMVAGLDRRKGHLYLVRAGIQVCRAMPEAHIYLVGKVDTDDEYLAQIRSEIDGAGLQHRVHLIGPVESAPPWIRSFDIYCIPSLSEALAVAGIEAMSLERPIVATRVGGNVEAVVDGVTGRLCEPADADGLTAAILELARSPALRERMGSAGYSRACDMFSLKQNGARLAAVLRSLSGVSLEAD